MNLKPLKKFIRYVDGFLIRNTLDINFNDLHWYSTNPSDYFPKFYIPPNEIWVDHIFKDELDFLLTRDLYWLALRQGSYFQQPAAKNPLARVLKKDLPKVEKKIVTGKAERQYLKAVLCRPGPIPNFTRQLDRQAGLKVRYVDGKIIRLYLDPEFVFGGHHYVYPYVPKNEIWLDAKMDKRELPYVYLHEKIERTMMKNGANYDYSHEVASSKEKEAKRQAKIASYPGDEYHDYQWRSLTTKEIINKFYVSK